VRGRNSQRGWVGLIVLLLALLIVAVLSQKMLRQMGLLTDDRVTTKTAGPRGLGPSAPVDVDPTGATPTPGNALERAKGVESTVLQQSQDMGQRIDAQTK
jgi:hypothetical protein